MAGTMALDLGTAADMFLFIDTCQVCCHLASPVEISENRRIRLC